MIEWVVTGAGGALGSVLMRMLSEQRKPAEGFVSREGPLPHVGKVSRVDLTDPRSYQERLFALAPRVIVHLAGVSSIAGAFGDPERARAINVEATAQLVAYSQALGARLLFASTDLVFDGEAAPYGEDAAPEPATIYGLTKLEAECHVLTHKRGLVLRLPLLYGLPDVERAPTFFENLVSSLRAGRPVSLFEDEWRTPLWLDDAARACLALGETELAGVLHLGGPERLSRFEMGERVAEALHADAGLLRAACRSQLQAPEPRARDVSLDNVRYQTEVGGPAGLTMRESLPHVFAHGPSRLLS